MQLGENNDTAGGCGEDWVTFLGWSMNGVEGFFSIVETSEHRSHTFKTRLAMPLNDRVY
jgi:hypothetical protein